MSHDEMQAQMRVVRGTAAMMDAFMGAITGPVNPADEADFQPSEAQGGLPDDHLFPPVEVKRIERKATPEEHEGRLEPNARILGTVGQPVNFPSLQGLDHLTAARVEALLGHMDDVLHNHNAWLYSEKADMAGNLLAYIRAVLTDFHKSKQR
jgi:hypothetical protein